MNFRDKSLSTDKNKQGGTDTAGDELQQEEVERKKRESGKLEKE